MANYNKVLYLYKKSYIKFNKYTNLSICLNQINYTFSTKIVGNRIIVVILSVI